MWKCKNCDEENEDSFDSCWSCGLSQDSAAPPNTKKFQSTKEKIERTNNITDYNSTYGTSRMIAKSVSFVGWVIVSIGVLILLVSLKKISESDGGFALMGLFPALAGVISGLLLVMAGQLTRAMIDTADNTGHMLFLMNVSNSISSSSRFCDNCFFSSKVSGENVNAVLCSNKNIKVIASYVCDEWKPKG